MLRQLPPLDAIEAFFAAAQSNSFRTAAARIAVSPSAFSRRIQTLEAFLGIALFDRAAYGVQLTPAGEEYLGWIGPAVETIRRATARAHEGRGRRQLRVAASHSLAAEWLMPRLPQLLQDHGISVALTTSRDSRLLRSGAVDLGIWAAMPAERDIGRQPIAALDAVPVSAKCMADGRLPPGAVDALGEHRLLSDRFSGGIWRRWLASVGYAGPPARIDDSYETSQLKNEAAASGLGVALAIPLAAERILAEGRLFACAPLRASTREAYCVHYLDHGPWRRGPVQTFLNWLLAEADRSVRRFDEWFSRQTDEPAADARREAGL